MFVNAINPNFFIYSLIVDRRASVTRNVIVHCVSKRVHFGELLNGIIILRIQSIPM